MELYQGVMGLRPKLAVHVSKYVNTWFTWMPMFGQDWNGDDGVLRYSTVAKNSKMVCCTPSALLKSASKRLNLTLDYVDAFQVTWDQENMTDIDRFGYLIKEDEADVINLSNLIWSPLVAEESSLITPESVALTLPYTQIHELVTVVPKKLTQPPVFDIFLVLPNKARFFLLVSFPLYCFSQWVSNRKKGFFHALFYYFSLTLAQTRIDKRLLAVIWAIAVSFLIVQFISDQLFSQLTTNRFSWPHSIAELADSKDIECLTSNQLFIQNSGMPVWTKIAKKSKGENQMDDFLGKLRSLSTGHMAFIGRTVEVEWMQNLLHPDKFEILEERYFMSDYVFCVSTKWPLYKKFIQIANRLLEAGFRDYRKRPSAMISYALRLTHPKLLEKMFEISDNPQIALNKTFGVFVLYGIGNFLAIIIHYLSCFHVFL